MLRIVGGKQRRSSTKKEASLAKQIAEDWYLTCAARTAPASSIEKTFKQAADQFLKEYEIITEGQRSPRWVEGHWHPLAPAPFALLRRPRRLRGDAGQGAGIPGSPATTPPLGKLPTSRAGARAAIRAGRHKSTPAQKAPARSTLHDEIVTLRQVLKTAIRHGWLDHLPDLSPPYRTQGKVVHRPWFSPAEYKQLYEATRAYAHEPFHDHYRWNAEQVHDFVLFMANTGLRPDEARNLQHRDVTIVEDEATGERILEIEVRGKRGVGYCKSMPSAVRPYERLLARAEAGSRAQGKRARRRRDEQRGDAAAPPKQEFPQPTDHVFPGNHIKLFNGVLERTKLKIDRDGNRRTAYSLRHTYICMRLMEGADIYQIAKNCRTSVEMIEKFYAAHIKNTLDAAAINVLRPSPRPARESECAA